MARQRFANYRHARRSHFLGFRGTRPCIIVEIQDVGDNSANFGAYLASCTRSNCEDPGEVDAPHGKERQCPSDAVLKDSERGYLLLGLTGSTAWVVCCTILMFSHAVYAPRS